MEAHIAVNIRERRFYATLAAAFIAMLSFPIGVFGQRASEMEMDSAAKSLEEYLADIRVNYRTIDGLILKRGKANAEEIADRFAKEQLSAGNPLDKAIYGYLLARTHYWNGFHQFKATRDPQVFSALRPKVLTAFLAAFKDVRADEESNALADQLRGEIVGAFASVLATNIWGAALSQEEKQQAIVDFVDVVEKMPDAGKMLPAGESLVRMYRNLGIEARLDQAIPTELPRDYKDLLALLDKLSAVVADEQLLPIAEALASEHMAQLENSPDRLKTVAQIYRLNGMYDKSFQLLSVAAAQNSKFFLDLYALSLGGRLDISVAEGNAYLDKFIAGGATGLNGGAETADAVYSRCEAYRRAVTCLSDAGCCKECLELISRYEGDDSFPKGIRGEHMDILLAKARCLDKIGDTGAAVIAYRVFLEKAGNLGDSYIHGREWVEQRVRKLEAKK